MNYIKENKLVLLDLHQSMDIAQRQTIRESQSVMNPDSFLSNYRGSLQKILSLFFIQFLKLPTFFGQRDILGNRACTFVPMSIATCKLYIFRVDLNNGVIVTTIFGTVDIIKTKR